MTDVFSKAERSGIMRKIKSKNTKPEMALRSALHRKGFRFRIHAADLPGKPDVVLPKYKNCDSGSGMFLAWPFMQSGRFAKFAQGVLDKESWTE